MENAEEAAYTWYSISNELVRTWYTKLLWTIIIFLSWQWHRSFIHRLPGPRGYPFLGCLLKLDPKAAHVTLTKMRRMYGEIFGLYLGGTYTVVISNVKLIKKFLAADGSNGRPPLFLTHGIMGGFGVISSEGCLWKDQRRFLTGCLRTFGVKKYGPRRQLIEEIVMKEVNDCIEYIKGMNEGGCTTFNPTAALRHNIGSTINRVVFGLRYERGDPNWTWLQDLQEEGVRHIGVAGIVNFIPIARFIPRYYKIYRFLIDGKKRTHEFYKKIVDERLKAGRLPDRPDNILEAFLAERKLREGSEECEKYYSFEQCYHLLADCFGAGLDTTLVTISWYMLYMANNVDIQNRVQKDLDTVLGDRLPTLEDIEKLPYVEASIAETMRIRSVVPVGMPHGTTKTLTIDGHTVPKGSMIIPLQWAVHMDPELWEDPESFKPNRFINDQGKFFKPEHFIPFQTGKRMCVGDEFARMLLFLFAASFMKTFEVRLPEHTEADLEGAPGITLAPKYHELTFKFRQ